MISTESPDLTEYQTPLALIQLGRKRMISVLPLACCRRRWCTVHTERRRNCYFMNFGRGLGRGIEFTRVGHENNLFFWRDAAGGKQR